MTSFSPNPNIERFYVAYLKEDPTKEPIAIGYSISGIIPEATERIDRRGSDFEVQEISSPPFSIITFYNFDF